MNTTDSQVLPSSQSSSRLMQKGAAKNVLVLQHEGDTDAALIGAAAIADGATLTVLNARTDVMPNAQAMSEIDAVIVLGSVDSVNDEQIQDWFEVEKQFLQDVDAVGVPVLGICFGAQALAVALGGSVTRAPYGEYGWKMIDATNPEIVPEGPWFQWHVDAITPPPEAEILATTECCVQAYRVGQHLAVQFHPEITVQHATEWPPSDPTGLFESGMSAQEMIETTEALLPDATKRASALWSAFIDNANR